MSPLIFGRDVRGGETFLPAKFSGRLKRKGVSQLRILSARNDWYANSETPDLEQALAAYAARFDRVQMFGFSMGGFGAFRFAKTMGAAQVLAVSPTFGIWADVHMFGRRRAEDLPDDLPDPQFFMPQPDSTLRGVIALDSMRDRDMVHMRKMHSLFPGVDLARLPFSGHPAGQVIREGGAYQTLVNEAIAPHPSAQNIVATYRAVRRQSPSYFRRRARSLRPRWPDLADLAQVQHKNLRPH